MTSMIVETANAQHVAAVVIADVMTPPPSVDYLAWAEANIVFSERESQLSHRRFEPWRGLVGSEAERTITGRPGAWGRPGFGGAERSEFSALCRKW